MRCHISYAKGVGVIDKPHTGRTENARFVALVSLFEQLEAHIKQFITNTYRLAVLTACMNA